MTRFHGLFVGVDHYKSPSVNWLANAVNDATAVHALFTDTLGGFDGVLLTDAGATSTAVREGLKRLAATVPPDDVVVLSFSGHGTPNHCLVTYDTDPASMAATSVSLDELAHLVSAIGAGTVVCLLDCCFSGGMGAKVFDDNAPRARDIASEEAALGRIAGTGRIVFTASDANQPAFEFPALGHGLFTYHLVQALMGQPETLVGDDIDWLRLVSHVARQVSDAAQLSGLVQTPTMRGKVDGVAVWPRLIPGALYRAAFPGRSHAPVTRDWASLAGRGVPDGALELLTEALPGGLNELQVTAVNDYGVLDGKNLVVTAPTSSGKTMIGELAALSHVGQRRRAVFLLPMKALVNDKYQQFTATYGQLGMTVIRATGDHDDQVPDLLGGRFDIALLTYEKFTGLARANPHLLRIVGVVVVDEAQMIVDRSRGADLEFLLTLIRQSEQGDIDPQIIALSAVIGDTGGLEHWLNGHLLRTEKRPVPLSEGVLYPDGTWQTLDEHGDEHTEHSRVTPVYSGKNSSQELVIPLVQKLVGESKKVIVFRETKPETIGCASYLARGLGLPPATDALASLTSADASTASASLRQTLAAGVAFHNADLDRTERQVVEEQFRDRTSPLRVLVATTTVAMGVNTPAEAVVVVGLTHPGPTPERYSVAEYKNMVGRAGRLGFSDHGESYLIATGGLHPLQAWQYYVNGRPEDLTSKFMAAGTDPRSVMLRTLAALARRRPEPVTKDELLGFLEASFGAFQAARADPSWTWNRPALEAQLTELVGHQLIDEDPDGGYRPSTLGQFAGESGIEVETVIRLVEVIRPLPAPFTAAGLVTAAQFSVELDSVFFPIQKKGKNTEHVRWPHELAGQGAPGYMLNSLGYRSAEPLALVTRAKKAMAALLWASDVPLADAERHLTRHMRNDGNVAGAMRQVAARTRDILPSVVEVTKTLHPEFPLGDLPDRTAVRLEFGVPAALAKLAMAVGATLDRGDYLALLADGLADPTDVATADMGRLTALCGRRDKAIQTKSKAAAAVAAARSDAPLLPPPTE